MRINLLKTSPDRAGRYLVQFDDGSSLRLYRQTLEDFGLYSGMELTDAELSRLRNASFEMSAKMRAVRIVSAANVSKTDLENRLVQKGEKPQQARDAVAWLEELHLLDDRKTAEQLIHSCISKGFGLARAKQVLFEKRIPKDLWSEVLTDYPDQEEYILSFLKGRKIQPGDDKSLKKAIDALLRRGHKYSTIKAVLSELRIEAEDILEDE